MSGRDGKGGTERDEDRCLGHERVQEYSGVKSSSERIRRPLYGKEGQKWTS